MECIQKRRQYIQNSENTNSEYYKKCEKQRICFVFHCCYVIFGVLYYSLFINSLFCNFAVLLIAVLYPIRISYLYIRHKEYFQGEVKLCSSRGKELSMHIFKLSKLPRQLSNFTVDFCKNFTRTHLVHFVLHLDRDEKQMMMMVFYFPFNDIHQRVFTLNPLSGP